MIDNATFTDESGDIYEASRSLNGKAVTLTLNDVDEVTFYAADAAEIIKIIKQAAA